MHRQKELAAEKHETVDGLHHHHLDRVLADQCEALLGTGTELQLQRGESRIHSDF